MTNRLLEPTRTPTDAILAGPLGYGLAVLALRPVLLLVGALALRAAHVWAGYLNVLMVAVDVVTLVVVAALLHRRGGRLRDLLGRSRGVREVGWAALTFVIVVVGFLAATFVANLLTYGGAPPAVASDGYVPPVWLGVWTLAVMPVTVAFAEELAYRGYGLHSLATSWHKGVAVIVAAAFFGLQHVPLSMETPQAMVSRFLATFLAGLMFGGLVCWQRRLVPVIAAHWLLDVLFLGLPMLAWSLS